MGQLFLDRFTSAGCTAKPAALAVLGACVLTASCVLVREARAAAPCAPGTEARVWLSPAEPIAGRPLSIMATGVRQPLPAEAQLLVDGKPAEAGSTPGNFYRVASIAKAPGHTFRVELRAGARVLACTETKLANKTQRAQPDVHWQSRKDWDAAYESYFSAWVQHLFSAAPDEALEFRPLAQALTDPKRNALHNHLGLREDDAAFKGALKAAPDCADLPYVLRAYFAWKHELPFGFRECDRGNGQRPPRCPTQHTNEEPSNAKDPLSAFRSFLRLLVNKVHSGSLRTALGDDETDFYPVPLTREALRPGTIFADPYGHVLVLSTWVERPNQPGLLFAVDGQPDASVGRKRFWEGNFLYANDVASAGAGWKAFRPLVRKAGSEASEPTLVALSNAELERRPPQPYSDQQAKTPAEGFYARMFALVNPEGLTATVAYDDVLQALVEQIEGRVRSVDNGEQYMRQTNNRVIEMPDGARIFETVGPWEDYATPSRDMRLLIAMKVLEDLPARVTRHPQLFRLEGKSPEKVRAELEARHQRLTRERTVTYKNSDGKDVRLPVAEVIARRHAFETAYNPNDCVELRWGAKEGSDEHRSCRRQAPAEQRQRMDSYRVWFASTRRPPRE